MTGTDSILETPEAPSGAPDERFRNAARAIASWDVTPRPSTNCAFFPRVSAVRHALKQLEKDLVKRLAIHAKDKLLSASDHPAILELCANYRLLRAAVAALDDLRRVVVRLPRIVNGPRPEEPRIAAVADLYLHTVEGVFSAQTFHEFMRALQSVEPLTLDELWTVASFLRFSLLEDLLAGARSLLHSTGEAPIPPLSVGLKSLRSIEHADWVAFIEPLILFDNWLRQDPANAYTSMDFESRDLYRKHVAYIARYSDCTESQVAKAAFELAQQGATERINDPRVQLRRRHVGYYLLDNGLSQLADRVGFHPPVLYRMRRYVRAYANDFYINGIQLLTILFVAAVCFPILLHFSGLAAVLVTILFVLVPATQDAVDLVNSAVTTFFEPNPLPKLDFSKGIPQECTTLVTVPSLLLNEKQVRALVNDLEVRFLANRDPHLHFALLTDLPDSATKPHSRDSHPLVDLAIQLIDALNERYASPHNGSFLLLHRHRVFNTRQGVWMGWERKRGKLIELNNLLSGGYDAFPIKAGKLDALKQVRYILTLDSDTQLPLGSAAQLAGAIAHPLNQAIIDPRLRIVTAGYGILQPHIGITVRSASRSRLAAIYSGQNGFDIYARAVSDAYQDLFGEGIFTGKGIYEVAALHAVLNHRFPRNALLSHDLIEGAYARASLAADIELIDDYPSHYSAYSRRKHRWMRGDWQIAQWMFSRVPDESGRPVPNPISDISRWKIFDNLRRSLVDPFLFLLFIAGWLGLPGGPLYWTIVPLVLLVSPTVLQLGFGLVRALVSGQKGQVGDSISGFGRAALIILLQLILLPHQTLLAFDAIFRSLFRRFITGERLLEWETAAQSESSSAKRAPVDRYLAWTPAVVIGVAALVWFFAPHHNHTALLFAAPILLLWALGTVVTAWLNRPPYQHKGLPPATEEFLLSHALRMWRYFYQFSSERHNYLIPDNVEEDGLFEAGRVSPTNIGLLVNARQAAYEFGFITAPEFADLTRRSLASIARLEKFHGHLYNWYDTQTLKPLDATPFISSVDSGNFVASLYTLHAGAQDIVKRPLLSMSLFSGLRAHLRLICEHKDAPAQLAGIPFPDDSAMLADWIAWLPLAEAALKETASLPSAISDSAWWITETQHRIAAIRVLLREYLPWMLPEYESLRALQQLGPEGDPASLSIGGAIALAEILDRALDMQPGDGKLVALRKQLHVSLPMAINNLWSLANDLQTIARDAKRLAEETEFAFLVDPHRHILSIGYDMGKHRLHEACYDMIASEARVATFLAIARGDLPCQSWSRLARDHAHAGGRFLLFSWTGTMFEYLMPALWMRSSQGTLLARTHAACVHVQRRFVRSLGLPWGISESGGAQKNDDGHYCYQAYGVPAVALSFEATAGPVISPYSTFLALGVDTRAALRNLRRMVSAQWVGAYGFYEAADYTASRRTPELVREWMAHHQGMSLLATLNLLHDNIVQRWFHSNPLVRSAELLLHEIPPGKATLRSRLNECTPLRVGR